MKHPSCSSVRLLIRRVLGCFGILSFPWSFFFPSWSSSSSSQEWSPSLRSLSMRIACSVSPEERNQGEPVCELKKSCLPSSCYSSCQSSWRFFTSKSHIKTILHHSSSCSSVIFSSVYLHHSWWWSSSTIFNSSGMNKYFEERPNVYWQDKNLRGIVHNIRSLILGLFVSSSSSSNEVTINKSPWN